MRVYKHPILGDLEDRKKVSIIVDGKIIEAIEDEPIASALLAAGIIVFHKTRVRREPRGYFCGIGLCSDCVVTVDGTPNIRSCITPVKNGMKIMTQTE